MDDLTIAISFVVSVQSLIHYYIQNPTLTFQSHVILVLGSAGRPNTKQIPLKQILPRYILPKLLYQSNYYGSSPTQVYSTKVDHTQVKSTKAYPLEGTSVEVDPIEVNSTEVDPTVVNSTKITSLIVVPTEANIPKVNSTKPNKVTLSVGSRSLCTHLTNVANVSLNHKQMCYGFAFITSHLSCSNTVRSAVERVLDNVSEPAV